MRRGDFTPVGLPDPESCAQAPQRSRRTCPCLCSSHPTGASTRPRATALPANAPSRLVTEALNRDFPASTPPQTTFKNGAPSASSSSTIGTAYNTGRRITLCASRYRLAEPAGHVRERVFSGRCRGLGNHTDR
jgi:hypothetical protein